MGRLPSLEFPPSPGNLAWIVPVPWSSCVSDLLSPGSRNRLPLVLHWHHPRTPLPVRPVRVPAGSRPRRLGLEAPPWWHSGPVGRPFDFCYHMQRLCQSIARRCPELGHIDMGRILIGITQARSGSYHGLQARVTPLRFRQGLLHRRREGVIYQVQRYLVDGVDMLYLLHFCLPRFLDQRFEDKLVTVFHELFHISPTFEGDLRRLSGSCSLHSHSKRNYDAHMASLARSYLDSGADSALHDFLRLDFAQLSHRHGAVHGVMVPRPRLLPVPHPATEEFPHDD